MKTFTLVLMFVFAFSLVIGAATSTTDVEFKLGVESDSPTLPVYDSDDSDDYYYSLGFNILYVILIIFIAYSVVVYGQRFVKQKSSRSRKR
ncbi:MAG: hypothetical protein ACI83O_000121 [Patescibacteria group bacterium]|jgi:hypothetical protein